jgi:hypothetical protein
MATMNTLPLAFLALLALAGCSAPAPVEAPEVAAPPPVEPGPWRSVVLDTGAMGAEAESWLAGNTHPDSHNTSLPFEMRVGATGLVAELAWDDAASDLDLHVRSHVDCIERPTPEFVACEVDSTLLDPTGSGTWRADGGMPGAGDSPIRFVLTQDDLALYPCKESCDWQLQVWAKATPGTDFRVAVTVF